MPNVMYIGRLPIKDDRGLEWAIAHTERHEQEIARAAAEEYKARKKFWRRFTISFLTSGGAGLLLYLAGHGWLSAMLTAWLGGNAIFGIPLAVQYYQERQGSRKRARARLVTKSPTCLHVGDPLRLPPWQRFFIQNHLFSV